MDLPLVLQKSNHWLVVSTPIKIISQPANPLGILWKKDNVWKTTSQQLLNHYLLLLTSINGYNYNPLPTYY